MFLPLIFILFSSVTSAQSSCDPLFNEREFGLVKAEQAYQCYDKQLSSAATREDKSHALNQMSYLKFFIAEYFLNDKTDALFQGIELAEKSVLLFGPKYSLKDYKSLSPSELKLLAVALYNYGLITARYIDIKGVMEALSRMADIKKSMLTIIRLNEETTAHYGAHRTLGIFYFKVPGIAGGDMKLAKEYLDHAIAATQTQSGVCSYPANNIALAEWFYKSEQLSDACAQLKKVISLTPEAVRALKNGLFYESSVDVKKAQQLFSEYRCP